MNILKIKIKDMNIKYYFKFNEEDIIMILKIIQNLKLY